MRHRITGVLLILFLFPGILYAESRFYLGTDGTFAEGQQPYVTLEGDGRQEYQFRVYRIEKPFEYIAEEIEKRRVSEKESEVYANPLALFRESSGIFVQQLRSRARRELNVESRSHLKAVSGMEYPDIKKEEPAVIAPLENHTYLYGFIWPEGKNAWTYQRVPLPELPKGVFLVEAIRGAHRSHTVVIVSAVNFITKQSDSKTVVFVAQRVSGAPVSGAEVSIRNVESGLQIAKGVTGRDGVFVYRGDSGRESLVLCRHGEDIAISDPEFFSSSFYERGGHRAYIFTDRPVYRPGDTVHVKSVLRRYSSGSYHVAGGSAEVWVENGKGDTVAGPRNVQLDDAGEFDTSFALPDDRSSYRGRMYAKVRYNRKVHDTGFSMESYRKPPFEVKVLSDSQTYRSGSSVNVNIEASYYYGSPLAKKKVKVRVFRNPAYSPNPVGSVPFFIPIHEYLGIDDSVQSEPVLEKELTLDSDGRADFSFTPEGDSDYHYTASAVVADAGRSISGATGFDVYRSDFYIAMTRHATVFSPGENVRLSLELVPFRKDISEQERKEMCGNREIQVLLRSRSFQNISSEGPGKVIYRKTIRTSSDGSAEISLPGADAGHYVLIARSKDKEKAETESITAFWISGKNDTIQSDIKKLILTRSKDIYQVGDKAEVLVVSPVSGGTLLLTVEGEGIYSYHVVKMEGNSYRFPVRIKSQHSPNFTVTAQQMVDNKTLAETVRVSVPPVEKALQVKCTTEKSEYRPGDKVTLQVSVKNHRNRPESVPVAISVVDDSIYAISRDRTPSPLSFFYHPRRNNVVTTYSSSYRFFGYSEAQRLDLALNRHENPALASLKDRKPDRQVFRDTAFWQGTVTTDRNGNGKVTFTLPDNLTRWRVTARAVSSATSVGENRYTFVARKKLQVQGTVPRVLFSGDAVTVGARVTNMSGSSQKVEVTCRIPDGTGEPQKETLSVENNESAQVFFSFSAGKKSADTMPIQFTANSASLSDSVHYTIPVKQWQRKDVVSRSLRVDETNTQGRMEFQIPAAAASERLEIFGSAGYGDTLKSALEYLVGYPYGCIEQTLSRFIPLMAAAGSGFSFPQWEEEMPAMVQQGLLSVYNHQRPDGSFPWYGEDSGDMAMTAYVYRALAMAADKGYEVQQERMQRTRRFLYRQLTRSTLTSFERAYIIEALSHGGEVQASMLVGLMQQYTKQKDYGKLLTALALAKNNRLKDARMIYNSIPPEFGANEKTWEDDSVETAAAYLALAVMLKDTAGAEKAEDALMSLRRGKAWKNSRDTAMAVMALSSAAKWKGTRLGESEITLTYGGREQKMRIGQNSPSSVVFETSGSVSPLLVTYQKGAPADISVLLHYNDKSSNFTALEQGLSVERNYELIEAGSDGFLSFAQKDYGRGDLIMVTLRIQSGGSGIRHVMVEDPLPHTFSVVTDDTLYYSNERRRGYSERYVHDDRVILFVPYLEGSRELHYFLRADLPGVARILPSEISSMYYPGLKGNSSDGMVRVK